MSVIPTTIDIHTQFENGTLEESLNRLILAGKEKKLRISLCTTGAGVRTNWFLTALPGSSKLFVEGVVPYHRGSSFKYVDGREFESSVCPYAGSALANAAFLGGMNALLAKPSEEENGVNLIGVGATAAIASDGRRGKDRIEIGIRTLDSFYRLCVELEKADGPSGRAWQQSACDLLILNAIFAAADLEQIRFPSSVISSEYGQIHNGQVVLEKLKSPNYQGDDPVLINQDGTVGDIASLSPEKHIIYSGSFRRFHAGHDLAARNAFLQTNKQVVLEITAGNIGREPSTMAELLERSIQMRGRWPVILRKDCSKFSDKAKAYPGFEFIVGFDTAIRIVNPEFYNNNWEAMVEELDQLSKTGARFHVLGRVHPNTGVFQTADDIWCAHKHHRLFVPLAGRVDVSASALVESRS